MRKFLILMLAGFFIAGLAVSVKAAELKTSGFYRIGFDMTDNMGDFNDTLVGDNSTSFIQQRFGYNLAWVTDKSLKAVINFEIDNGLGYWGGEPSAVRALAGAGGSLGQFGNDDNLAVEVKEAYMEFLIPGTEVTAKLGPQTYFIGGTNFLYRDAAGITLTMPVKPMTLSLLTYKIREGSTAFADDTDMYGLWLRGTTSGVNVQAYGMWQTQNSPTNIMANTGLVASGTVTPAAGTALPSGTANTSRIGNPAAYIDGLIVTSNANLPVARGAIMKADYWWLGVSAETKSGPWSIFGNAIWSQVDADLTPVAGAPSSFKTGGLLLDAILGYQMGNFKLEVEGLWTSEVDWGKAEPDAFFIPSSETSYFTGKGLVFFAPAWDYAVGNRRGDMSAYTGLWFGRAAGTMKVSDQLSATLNFVWIGDNVKNGELLGAPVSAVNADDNVIGQEIDLLFNYKIYKTLILDAGFGYLFADKALDATVAGARRAADDAWVAAARLMTTF